MIGDDLHQRDRSTADLARHDRHLRQVAQADPRQLDPRKQAAPGLDPAIDVPAAPFDRMDGDFPFVGMGQQRLDHPESAAVQRHRHRAAPLPSAACRNLFRALYIKASFYLSIKAQDTSSFSTTLWPGVHAVPARRIESREHSPGARTVTISENEILTGLNSPKDFILAIGAIERDSSVRFSGGVRITR